MRTTRSRTVAAVAFTATLALTGVGCEEGGADVEQEVEEGGEELSEDLDEGVGELNEEEGE